MSSKEEHISQKKHELIGQSVFVGFCPEDLEYQPECEKEYEGKIINFGQNTLTEKGSSWDVFYLDVKLCEPFHFQGKNISILRGQARYEEEALHAFWENGWLICNIDSPWSQWRGARGTIRLKGASFKDVNVSDNAENALSLKEEDSEKTVYANEAQTLVICEGVPGVIPAENIDYSALIIASNDPDEKFPLEEFLPQITAYAEKIHYRVEINRMGGSVFLIDKIPALMPKRIIILGLWKKDVQPRTLGLVQVDAMSFSQMPQNGGFLPTFVTQVYRQVNVTSESLQNALDKAYALIKDK